MVGWGRRNDARRRSEARSDVQLCRQTSEYLRIIPCQARVLQQAASALIAVSSAFTCCATFPRSAFNWAIMSMCSPRARIVQEITDSGRPPLNQCNKRSQSIVNLIALLRAESAAFLYQVLTNRLMCGFYTLRKCFEIKFDHSSVVQILPCGIGHSGLPCRGARKRGEFQGYCASAVATLAQVAILAFHKVFS